VAAARKPRLKVFQAQLGFFDTVVAAPSQAAALRAWGVHQDLFAEAWAQVTADAAAAKAALAHPGSALRRAAGSHDAFELQPDRLPSPPAEPRRGRKAPAAKKPPDRAALDHAEAALTRLDEDREQDEAAFKAQQAELDNARRVAAGAYDRARRKAQSALEAARRRYREAGGKL
jgi:hypothetical protein